MYMCLLKQHNSRNHCVHFSFLVIMMSLVLILLYKCLQSCLYAFIFICLYLSFHRYDHYYQSLLLKVLKSYSSLSSLSSLSQLMLQLTVPELFGVQYGMENSRGGWAAERYSWFCGRALPIRYLVTAAQLVECTGRIVIDSSFIFWQTCLHPPSSLMFRAS